MTFSIHLEFQQRRKAKTLALKSQKEQVRTRSFMGFDPIVRTRWQASWTKKTVTRRESISVHVVQAGLSRDYGQVNKLQEVFRLMPQNSSLPVRTLTG
jgi:hypothetical protein